MHKDNLREILAKSISAALGEMRESGPHRRSAFSGGAKRSPVSEQTGDLDTQGRLIAEELLQQAVASGIDLKAAQYTDRSLKGGNTAEFVGEFSLSAPFVFKLDNKSKKLANEGLAIRQIKSNPNLPDRFRDAWPLVYAVRTEPPYAYLMEIFPNSEGWLSLEDSLYSVPDQRKVTASQANRFITTILDTLLEGYEESVNIRQHPSIYRDYVIRIKERLEETERIDHRFGSRSINVNGVSCRPWREYVDLLEKKENWMHKITPPFTTVVHGDPNPGNLMLRASTSTVELKLIDPKEWITGDYLFDICKITHFLEATGPIEKPMDGTLATADLSSSDGQVGLSYKINPPSWTHALVEACRDRTDGFASNYGDKNWRQRYELGMASNLLGLPLNRLKKGKIDTAMMLYGEGLKWLERFCSNMASLDEGINKKC